MTNSRFSVRPYLSPDRIIKYGIWDCEQKGFVWNKQRPTQSQAILMLEQFLSGRPDGDNSDPHLSNTKKPL